VETVYDLIVKQKMPDSVGKTEEMIAGAYSEQQQWSVQ
jgi:hypothetical protein